MTSASESREIRVHVKRVAAAQEESAILVLGTRSRGLQVWIGPHDALAIVKAWRCWKTWRPTTTEALANALDATGVKVAKFVLAKLENGCFLGELHLKRGSERRLVVDCRPSDGVAVALLHKAPLYVHAAVMAAAAVPLADAQQTGEDFLSGVTPGSLAHRYWVHLLDRVADPDASLTLKLVGGSTQAVSARSENVIYMTKRARTFQYMGEYICNAAGLTNKRGGKHVRGTAKLEAGPTFEVTVSAVMPEQGLPDEIHVDARKL